MAGLLAASTADTMVAELADWWVELKVELMVAAMAAGTVVTEELKMALAMAAERSKLIAERYLKHKQQVTVKKTSCDRSAEASSELTTNRKYLAAAVDINIPAATVQWYK